MLMLVSDRYLRVVSAHFLLKVVTEGSFGSKKYRKNIKLGKYRVLGYSFKAKTKECKRKNSSVSDKFGMLIYGSDTYFLEVSAHVSLNVATKASFRDEKLRKFRFLAYFSKAKTEECDRKNLRDWNKFGMLMPGLDTYFLEMSAHVSLRVAIKG